MLADFAGFLQDVDIFLAQLRLGIVRVVLVNELRKPQRTCHSRRSAAYDDDIGGHLRTRNICWRFAEDQHLKFATA